MITLGQRAEKETRNVMRSTLIAMTLVAALPAQAMAEASFSFVSTGGTNLFDGSPFTPPPMTFTVTDHGFDHGLSLGWGTCLTNNGPCSSPGVGNFADLVAFTGVDHISPTALGSGMVDLSFNAAGDVLGALSLYGESVTLNMQDPAGGWTGSYSADGSSCGAVPDCTFTGYWKAAELPQGVPEPASWGLLAMGLLGAGVVRSRI